MTDTNRAAASAISKQVDAVGSKGDATDSLAQYRASGRCAPKAWGFLLDEARALRLNQLVAESIEPLPAWAVRECQRLKVPTRLTLSGVG